jgi:hypothetical protein
MTNLLTLALAVSPALDAVVHIGPHETGSSMIQDLCLGTLRQRLARNDGFYAIAPPTNPQATVTGRKVVLQPKQTYSRLAQVLRSESNIAANAHWRAFEAFARHAAGSGRRLLVSAEGLSFMLGQRAAVLPKFLASIGYKVKIVLVYRRLSERLPSMHSERMLKRDVAAKSYLPFVDWIEKERDFFPKALYGQTLALRDLYAERFGVEVSILNTHAVPRGSSLTTEFVCEHMRAEHTCAHLRAPGPSAAPGPVKKTKDRRRHVKLYDLVYAAAAGRGLASLPVARVVQRLVRLKVEQGEIPMRCVNASTYTRIWNATVAEERAVSPQALNDARVDFRQHAGAFCSVDFALLCVLPSRVYRLVQANIGHVLSEEEGKTGTRN